MMRTAAIVVGGPFELNPNQPARPDAHPSGVFQPIHARSPNRMYFNHTLFLRAEYIALFGQPFRLRRWLFVLFFTGLFLLMWLIVAFGRALDHLFFPGFRRQEVRAPIFIIAPPRSGTTLMQKLMSLDGEHFVHSKLYQTIFPCVLYQRLFHGIARVDRYCGAPLMSLIHWAEKAWFGGWDDMHKMRFNQPEEDDGFFVYTFVTEAIFLLFPFVDELWEAGFADSLPPEEQRKLMRYYKSCLQRQLYANGPGKTILAKATQLSGAVQCLLEAFPDARIVTIIRHPYEAVASHVSVFYPVWHAHSPEILKRSPASESYGRLAVEWYRHLYTMRSKIDPRQYYCVPYRTLATQPVRTVEEVYNHFGCPMSKAVRARLEEATCKQREYRSGHHYTLEEFGLSKKWVQDQIGDVMDAYCLAR